MFWHGLLALITILLLFYIGKNRCKIGNNTIIWIFLFAMRTKIVLKLSFEKLYIMIVTDMCAFVNACVIALEYILSEKWAKYHILFDKFQFTDQVAIKKTCNSFSLISLHVQLSNCHKTLFLTWVIALDCRFLIGEKHQNMHFKLMKAPKLTKKLKGSKSFHALDKSCHIILCNRNKNICVRLI